MRSWGVRGTRPRATSLLGILRRLRSTQRHRNQGRRARRGRWKRRRDCGRRAWRGRRPRRGRWTIRTTSSRSILRGRVTSSAARRLTGGACSRRTRRRQSGSPYAPFARGAAPRASWPSRLVCRARLTRSRRQLSA